VDVVQVLPHADWAWGAGPQVNDIAMMHLAVPLRLAGARIPRRSSDHGQVRLMGWGLTDPSATDVPTALQQLQAAIRPPQDCAPGGITAGELCVAPLDPTTGVCYGDSGSPALHRAHTGWSTLGIASRETTGTCAGPVIYTDLAAFHSWITTVIHTGHLPPAPDATLTAPTGAPVHSRMWDTASNT
jgi:secreted trypsin-like serine protease